jgi:ABC-type uncharacterized transport system substrate-binding protein
LVNDAANTEEKLQAILDKILNNTAKHHYFVQIEHASGEADFDIHEQATIGVRDHRIEVEFLLLIEPPLDPSHSEIVCGFSFLEPPNRSGPSRLSIKNMSHQGTSCAAR